LRWFRAGRRRGKRRWSPATVYLRPPGALGELVFLTQCTRCGKCIEACTSGGLKLARGDEWPDVGRQTPVLNPFDTPCNLCLRCIDACPTGALRYVRPSEVRMGTAQVNQRLCLNRKRPGRCSNCIDICPFGSELFQFKQTMPRIRTERCTGCGLCVAACAVHPPAITIRRRPDTI
jgi:MauM/NapG family ferredoxin protein